MDVRARHLTAVALVLLPLLGTAVGRQVRARYGRPKGRRGTAALIAVPDVIDVSLPGPDGDGPIEPVEGLEVVDSRPLVGAWLLDGLWRRLSGPPRTRRSPASSGWTTTRPTARPTC